MEEVKKFIQLLWRYRLIIILVPLLTIMLTYYIVRNIPDTFSAQTQIATGIVDETQQMAFSDASELQGSIITQKFINLTETMKSRPMIEQISYRLMLHDLESPEKAFRAYSPSIQKLSPAEKRKLIDFLTKKYETGSALNINDEYEKSVSFMITDMGYNYTSLTSNLWIFRVGETDFINISWQSESQVLSPFVVNTLAQEFIKDYVSRNKLNQELSVAFLRKLIQVKADTMARRIEALRTYKIRNRILNLEGQSSQLLGDITSYENQEQAAVKDLASLKGTIENIDKKFDPNDREYREAVITGPSQQIIGTREEVRALLDKYQNKDFDDAYKKSIDSLQRVQAANINKYNDLYINNPLTTKQTLVGLKTQLQIEYDRTINGLNSTRQHISDLKNNFARLVPHEAALQSLNRDIDIVQKEYQDLSTQYNQASMESEFPVKLRQIQLAMPIGPNPSKKMLLVLISAIVSFAFCIIAFFVVFFFDNRILRPSDLAIATNIPVLGYLNLVGKSTLDLQEIWKNLHGTSEMLEFKKQLRSTRFEVSKELATTSKRGQILSITSINKGEGKTLISASIAYTYVMINKKVLLIDGNFDNSSITENSNTKIYIEDYLQTGTMDRYDFNSGIMVMGNRGGDKSLLEVCDEKTIRERLDHLRSQFDIILVETPALESLNKSKEWILFSDKTLGVFEANQSITEGKKQHINYLTSINGQFIGWILNKVRSEVKPEKQKKIDVVTVIE